MFLISALYQRATLLWKRLSKTCLSSFEFPTSFINENPSFIMLQPKTNAFKSSSKNFMRTVYIFKCTILSLNGNLKKRTRIRLKFYLQIKVFLTKDGSLCDNWYSRNIYLFAFWLHLCYISKHWQLASMQPGLSSVFSGLENVR